MLGVAAVAAAALFVMVGVQNWPAAKLAAAKQAAASTPTAAVTAPITTPVVTTPVISEPTPLSPPLAAGTMIAAVETELPQTVVATPPATIAVREVVHATPLPTDLPPSTALVSVKWVNVRTAPTPSAAILGVIKPQTNVVVLASQDGWVRVKSDALTGWVYGQGVSEKY